MPGYTLMKQTIVYYILNLGIKHKTFILIFITIVEFKLYPALSKKEMKREIGRSCKG